MYLRKFLKFLIIFLISFAFIGLIPVWAQDDHSTVDLLEFTSHLKDWVQNFNGADAGANYTSGYSGLIIGLGGPLSQEGWRLRLSGNLSQYHYDSHKIFELRSGTNGDDFRVTYAGEQMAADAMLGYQWNPAPFWLKLYAGVNYSHIDTSMLRLERVDNGKFDPDDYEIPNRDLGNPSQGTKIGARILAEAWLPFGDSMWGSFSASGSTANREYSASGMLGMRLPQIFEKMPVMTLGPELAIFSSSDYNTLRGGGFARFEKNGYQFTISGGLSEEEDKTGAYVTAGIFHQF